MLVANLDADDPARAAFPPPKFYTIFLQKELAPDAGATGAPPPFDPRAFHDPRDIS